jgi:REP element-mobilizing transposase RayT
MGRAPRDESPGYHHVVTRGNNKRPIYEDDRDRTFFCLTVNRVARKNGWQVLAFVLMRNHYHLLLSVGDRGLSDGMCALNTAHAVQFNATHRRINHLFGKRFWNRPLTTDAAIRCAARYIAQNPVRAGGTRPLDAYDWSSYAATVGTEFSRIALAADELLPFFGSSPGTAIDAYRKFCLELPSPRELEETRPVPGDVTRHRGLSAGGVSNERGMRFV